MNIFEWLTGAANWQNLKEKVDILTVKNNQLNELVEFKDVEIEALKSMVKQESINGVKKYGTISSTELRQLLKPYCDEVHLSDRNYSLTSKDEARKYSIKTKVYLNKWQKEQYDCDEFSFALQGYWNLDLYQFAFGIAWSKTHAFNIMVDNHKQIWVVEPQSNSFMKIDDAKKKSNYFPFRFIII